MSKSGLRLRYLEKSQKKIMDSFYEATGVIDECIDATLLDKEGNIRSINLGPETNLFTRWAEGKIDTNNVIKYFDDVDIEKIADRKVMKSFELFETAVDDFVSNIYEALSVAREKLEKETRQKYINYLTQLRVHFRELKEIDDSQIKIIYNKLNHVDSKEPMVVRREMTVNQAISWITNNKLTNLNQKYILNDHVVIFEQMTDQGFVEKSHQFIGPIKYLDPIIAEFNIIIKRTTGDTEKWLKEIG